MPKNEDRDDEFEDEDEERRRRLRRRDPDDDDRPRRRRAPEPEVEATEFLIPTGVSRYSIAACYFGLLSCVPIPIFGIVLALIALPCGIAALRKKRKRSDRAMAPSLATLGRSSASYPVHSPSSAI